MNFDSLAASVVVTGFPGRVPGPDALALIDRGVAGVILFSENLGSPAEIAELTCVLKRRAARPFLLSVDQEGGRVARLRDGFTPLPPMRALGQANDPALAERFGRLLAEECRAVGFDLDFAPVADVDSNPGNPVIGDRSFGRSPEVCGMLGAALVRGLQGGGVAACAKHFPGHGDTVQDSHRTLPRLPHDLARLSRVELPPFAACVGAGVAAIMTAHVVFSALDADLPATLSPRVLALLSTALGFSGVTISDDLEMAAIADRFPIGEAAVRAVAAGCDLLLVCHRPDRQAAVIDELRRWAESSATAADRLRRAAEKVEALRNRWAAPPAGFDPKRLRRPTALALARRLGVKPSGEDPTDAKERPEPGASRPWFGVRR